MINMIWAMDKNNLIGDGNRIPWHIKEDLIYYKNKTKGQVVLMGDATYFSLKSYYKTKPLPYGKCYIATIDKNLKIENPLEDIEIIYDLDSFLKNFSGDLWVCGGATIYKLAKLTYGGNSLALAKANAIYNRNADLTGKVIEMLPI